MSYTCPETAPGCYALDGYYSMLQSDAGDFKTKAEKLINKVAIDFVAEDQTTPSLLNCNVAYGQQPECLTWDRTAQAKKLQCLTNKSRNQHALRKTRPDEIPSFQFHRRGVYVAWRFYIKGTGGGSCFNGVTTSLRSPQADWR